MGARYHRPLFCSILPTPTLTLSGCGTAVERDTSIVFEERPK